MKMEKMKESRRWLSWLPKALLATLLAGALAFVGCKSDDNDGGSGSSDGDYSNDAGHDGEGDKSEDDKKPEQEPQKNILWSENFANATDGTVTNLFVPDSTGTFTVEDGAVRFTPTGSGNRGVELSFNLPESEEPLSNVVVEFDAQFHEGSPTRNCELQVALGLGNVPSKANNAALPASNGIVLVHATKPNGGSVAFAEDNKAEISFFKTSQGKLTTPAWCHYKVVITAADDSYSAKLTVTTDSSTLCKDEAVPCAGIPSYLHLLAAREGSGVYLDNVEVYTLQ